MAESNIKRNISIIEEGTETVSNVTWTYRKWSSGRYEAWAFASSSATNYVAIGNWYGYNFNITLPSFMLTKDNLFMTCPLASGTQFCTPSGYVVANDSLRLYAISAGSGTQTIMFNLLMIGKWK